MTLADLNLGRGPNGSVSVRLLRLPSGQLRGGSSPADPAKPSYRDPRARDLENRQCDNLPAGCDRRVRINVPPDWLATGLA